MSEIKEHQIKFSKVKIFLFLLLLVFIGIPLTLLFVFLTTGDFVRSLNSQSLNHEVIGKWVISVWLFLWLGVYGTFFMIYRLFSSKPAMIINEAGIYISYPSLAIDFMPWEDVRDFSIRRVQLYRQVILYAINPQEYISRGHFLKRFSKKLNSWFFGSPIVIPVLVLQGGASNIQEILESYLHDASGDDQGVTEKQNFFFINKFK